MVDDAQLNLEAAPEHGDLLNNPNLPQIESLFSLRQMAGLETDAPQTVPNASEDAFSNLITIINDPKQDRPGGLYAILGDLEFEDSQSRIRFVNEVLRLGGLSADRFSRFEYLKVRSSGDGGYDGWVLTQLYGCNLADLGQDPSGKKLIPTDKDELERYRQLNRQFEIAGNQERESIMRIAGELGPMLQAERSERGPIVEIPADAPIIFIRDLHCNSDMIDRNLIAAMKRLFPDVVAQHGNDEETLLAAHEAIRDNKLTVVFGGDYAHSEGPDPTDPEYVGWAMQDYGNSNSPLIKKRAAANELKRYRTMLENINNLKALNPHRVTILAGDHDNLEAASLTKSSVSQGVIWPKMLSDDELIFALRNVEDFMPLLAYSHHENNLLLMSHAFPFGIENNRLEEIRRLRVNNWEIRKHHPGVWNSFTFQGSRDGLGREAQFNMFDFGTLSAHLATKLGFDLAGRTIVMHAGHTSVNLELCFVPLELFTGWTDDGALPNVPMSAHLRAFAPSSATPDILGGSLLDCSNGFTDLNQLSPQQQMNAVSDGISIMLKNLEELNNPQYLRETLKALLPGGSELENASALQGDPHVKVIETKSVDYAQDTPKDVLTRIYLAQNRDGGVDYYVYSE